MNYKAKSARVCHPMCHASFMVALHESFNLYGFVGMCATCATYLIKLFNKYITAPTGHGVMKVSDSNSLTKLRNIASKAALSAPWLWIKRNI